MIPLTLTLDDADGTAVVLALDFDTRRVIVRWGDEDTAHVTAYRLVTCKRCDGKGKLWDCRVQDEVRLRECFACGGSRSQWRRETVPHGYRVEALAGVAGDKYCRDIGEMSGGVQIQPAGVGTNALVSWLRAAGWSPMPTGGTLRGVCRWLARHRGALVHGWDLFDDLALECAVPIGCGGNEVDDLLGEMLRAGVVALYEYDPQPGAIFVTTSESKIASQLDGRMESDGWSASGAKHWRFKRGPRWLGLPAFDV